MEDRELSEMSLFDVITARRSHRGQFQDRPIRSGDINRLLEAAQWAPSPFNVQPWELLIIREIEGKIALADLTEKCVAEQFKDTKFLDDNRRWIRLTDEEWEAARDGVLLADHVNLPQILSKNPTKLGPLLKNAKPPRHLGTSRSGKDACKGNLKLGADITGTNPGSDEYRQAPAGRGSISLDVDWHGSNDSKPSIGGDSPPHWRSVCKRTA